MDNILSIRGLRKSYRGGFPVLRDLDLDFPSGRIIGLLGPNGCGKSTLIKLISGLLVADGGEITVCGEPRSERSNLLISYLPERPCFSPSMTVDELIDLFCDFYTDFDRESALAMLGDLRIDTKRRLKTLSKGNKEKVQLVMVMSRRARIYLLDEPIAGVDPVTRDYVLKTVIGKRSPDSTVIITTHLIHDIEPALDDFIFMGRGGEILMQGNCDKVREEKGKTVNQLFKEVFA